MLKMLVKLAFLAGLGAAVYAALPDLKRYVEMSRM